MVAIARYLNFTLIVPELDKSSFWADPRCVNWQPPNTPEILELLRLRKSLTIILLYSLLHDSLFSVLEWLHSSWYVSEFQDIFDVDHFITSLRDEIRILKELPPRLKRRVELGKIHTMAPISWSDISYYHNKVRFIAFHCFNLFPFFESHFLLSEFFLFDLLHADSSFGKEVQNCAFEQNWCSACQ